MEELYNCNCCGEDKEESCFETDFIHSTTKDEMTCESCYDQMDSI